MAGHPFWGLFKHRLKAFRKMKTELDDDLNIQPILHDRHTELTRRISGGIPSFYSMGDVNQLSHVALKSIDDDSNPNKSCCPDTIEEFPFLNISIHLFNLKLLILHFI